MNQEQEDLIHPLVLAVLNLGWHVSQLRQGSACEEIEAYCQAVETALRKVVPGRKGER